MLGLTTYTTTPGNAALLIATLEALTYNQLGFQNSESKFQCQIMRTKQGMVLCASGPVLEKVKHEDHWTTGIQGQMRQQWNPVLKENKHL